MEVLASGLAQTNQESCCATAVFFFSENFANVHFFLLQGAYNGALAWDFGEAGVCSRVVDGICRQRVWWWQ